MCVSPRSLLILMRIKIKSLIISFVLICFITFLFIKLSGGYHSKGASTFSNKLRDLNIVIELLLRCNSSVFILDRNLVKFAFHPDIDLHYLWHEPILLAVKESDAVGENENTWWYGNFRSDVNFEKKIGFPNSLNFTLHDGILNMFDSYSKHIAGITFRVLVPRKPNGFLLDLSRSYFIECNYSRALSFERQHAHRKESQGALFKHRAWKLISKAKGVLDKLSLPFWLSSGTCLGYFRECDIIPYSMDVDFGMFAKDYSIELIPEMEKKGLRLLHWFGTLNDSLELSFTDQSGIKLDIFFFYEDSDSYWNGGTQVRTGLKLKYRFPKFSLCWTIFLNMKVRIPCSTEDYVKANYGPNWFIPLKEWNWKSSPFNVMRNGYWPRSDRSKVIRVYRNYVWDCMNLSAVCTKFFVLCENVREDSSVSIPVAGFQNAYDSMKGG